MELLRLYVLTIARLAQLPAWQRPFAPMVAAGEIALGNPPDLR